MNSHKHISTTKQDHLVAMLAALAICIHVLEAALPSPVPGIKPGLANIITLLVFMQFGIRLAAWVSLLRVLVSSLILGTFISPTFILSLGGALCTLLALLVVDTLFHRASGWRPGPVGYSVAAAAAHISAQFFLAYVFFIPHAALLSLLPVLVSVSLVFGLISGLIAWYVLGHDSTPLLLEKQVQG